MIGFSPYAIVALLLIHSDSTNQSTYHDTALHLIGAEIHREQPANGSLLTHWLLTDIVCDVLNDEEKESLCDEAMEHMINKLHSRAGRKLVSFLNEESDLEEPHLLELSDSCMCRHISVWADNAAMPRDMYWCPAKRYKVTNSGESLQKTGFYISGSRKIVDTVFIFHSPVLHAINVVPLGKLESVDLLYRKWLESSSSSSASSSSSSSF